MPNTLELLDQQIKELEKKAKIEPTDTNKELLEIMKTIKSNQEIERVRYERNNAVEGDEPIHDWAESEVPSGYIVKFTFNVPEGWILFWGYPSINYSTDTSYSILIDGEWEPTLSDVVQDLGDHANVFVPPKKGYSKAEMWALNSSTETKTYTVFFGGFLRRISRAEEIEKKLMQWREEGKL